MSAPLDQRVTLSREVAAALRAEAIHPYFFDDSGSTENADGTVTMSVDKEVKAMLGADPEATARLALGMPPRRLH